MTPGKPQQGGAGDKGLVPTHAVTTPNQRPVTKIDTIKITLAGQDKQLLNYFMGNRAETARFKTAAIEYVRRSPKLLKCDPTSLIMSLITVAQFRFLPSGIGGEAYIIPYKEEAKFQLGYQGIITLLYRTNKVAAITPKIVYKNDKFEYSEGLNPVLNHVPTPFDQKRGEAIAVYTVVQMMSGARTFQVMSKEDVMAIKNLSKAKNSPESPWNSNLDPELWMWKKTCIIQHAKTLPKTPELQQALEKDFEGEGAERPFIDAAGPATGKAIHAPQPNDLIDDDGPGATGSQEKRGPCPRGCGSDTWHVDVACPVKGPKCPAGKHPADKMSTGECEYCTGEEFDQTNRDDHGN